MNRLWYRILFNASGKPRRWTRRVVFRKDRSVRPLFHRLVYKRSGVIRPHWANWVAAAPTDVGADLPSAQELALRKLRPFEQTIANWRRAERLPTLITARQLIDRLKQLGEAASAGIVLAASHDNYREIPGGVQVCLQHEERAAVARHFAYLQFHPAQPLPCLAPAGEHRDLPVTLLLNGAPIGTAAMAELMAAVKHCVSTGRAVRFVVHHLLGHSPEALVELALAARLKDVIFWLHDFFTLCPSFTLLRNGLAFCGAPDAGSNACGICVYGPSRREHQARIAAFFRALPMQVVAPSQVTADFWLGKAGLPVQSVAVVPHITLEERPRIAPAPVDERAPITVGYLGAAVTHKGWPVFADLMTRHSGSGTRFVVFSSQRPGKGEHEWHHVHVTAETPDAMSDALTRARIDIVLHWAACLETFSFTTFEALSAGAFVLTNPGSGNVQAVVRSTGRGAVIEDVPALHRLFAGDGLARLVAARRARAAATELKVYRSAMSFDLPGWRQPWPCTLTQASPSAI